jgi:hypothetical protein
MCFSASASLTASAICGAFGIMTIRRARRADIMLGLMPLIFSAQQSLEGIVWLTGGEGCGSLAANGFVIFAFIVWPLYTPLACWLSETASSPRKFMLALTGMGAVMALCGIYALHRGFTIDFSAHHIKYLPVKRYPPVFDYIYAFSAVVPLMLYQSIYIRIYGLLALTGFVVSTAIFNPGRYSVWCFFAALSSIALYFFIESKNASAQAQLVRKLSTPKVFARESRCSKGSTSPLRAVKPQSGKLL